MVKPYVVGLTGGLGSGKSTVADLFADKGVPVIDADMIARQLVEPGQPALKEIVAHYGVTTLRPDGTLDRAKLKNLIFNDATQKTWLENCLHPRIYDAIKLALKNVQAPYCLVVIPLLTESFPRYKDLINYVLMVDVPPTLQATRVSSRDHLDEALIQKMINSQASREARLAIADAIITNEGRIEDLKGQILALHDFFTRISLIY